MKSAKQLWIGSLILLLLLALGFAGYLVYGYFTTFNPLLVIIISMCFVLLAFLLTWCISIFYKWMGQAKERKEENKRNFGVDSYFDSKTSFIRKVARLALKTNVAQAAKRKADANEMALKIKAKAEGKEIVTPEGKKLKKKIRQLANGAFIAFSVFSDSESYQYYQLEKIGEFYGFVIKYFEELMKQNDYRKRFFAGYDAHVFYLYFNYEDQNELKSFLTKIETDLYSLYEKCDVRVNMHPSFGVFELNGQNKDVYKMMENAIVSLRFAVNSYQVFVFYDEKIISEAIHNDVLEQEIKRGIENHEFKVFYQGKFDLSLQKFVGAEALIRWQHPVKGLFNPAAFIGECEKSGLIHVLDFYVFDQVCKDLGDWKKRGRRMLPVSINFSSYDFYRPDFVESLQDELDRNNIASNFIEVEMTESSTATNYFYVMSVLKQLKDLNIRILMDDFGTGFSSLGNLKKYPISALKIDKSFVDEMQEDIKSKEIVSTIIDLARSLGLQSIAEGVQTEGQVLMLKEMKCNVVQGYYYSKPMAKKDFEVFLSTNQFEKKGILL